jgi:putative serine protease PepD
VCGVVDRDEWADEPGDDQASDPVLPPEQRWWRHPSELAAPGLRPALPAGTIGSRAPLVLAGAIGVIGALLVGLLVRASVSEPQGEVAIDASSIAAERTNALSAPPSSTSPVSTTVATTVSAPATTTAVAAPVLMASSGTAPAAVVSETFVLALATNLGRATEMTLQLPGGDEQKARLVYTDAATGVALLEVEVPLTTIAGGSASALAPGDDVWSAEGTVGELIEVVALQQQSDDPSKALLRVLMSDEVALGTPLYDEDGMAIGYCLNRDADGTTMVLPIEIARRLVDQADGAEPRAEPWLGIKGRSDDAGGGARLVKVFDDGPAATAGLRRNDLVVALDGVAVRSMGSLVLLLEGRAAGETVTVTVSRLVSGQEVRLDIGVQLGTRPVPSTTVAETTSTAASTTAAATTTTAAATSTTTRRATTTTL